MSVDQLASQYDSEIMTLRDELIPAHTVTIRPHLPYPWFDSAGEFHQFFDDKVAGVRSATADMPPPSFQTTSPVEPLLAFQPVSVSDVVTAVLALPDKSCSLDVLST